MTTALDTHLFDRPSMCRSRARADWSHCLADFSDRSIARRVVLETDREDFGAQTTAVGVPLRGICYDPRDGHVQIMLGDETASGSHRTHIVGSLAGIDTLSDASGRDVALRLTHLGGQTLLTFVR